MSIYHQSNRARSNGPQLRTFILAFVITALCTFGVFLLYKTFIKKDISIIPGNISLDETLTSEEKTFLTQIFDSSHISHDAKISATTENSYTDSENTLLYDVFVPVTGFNNPKLDIPSSEIAYLKEPSNMSETVEIMNSLLQNPDDTSVQLISATLLNNSAHLLSIDGNYYLDNFSSGAKFRVLHLESYAPEETKSLITEKLDRTIPNQENVLSINQTGTTGLTRALQTTLKRVGDGAYFAERIKDFLSKTDHTHISNEVSFADDCDISKGSMTLCADPRMILSLEVVGTDIIELTGNHNNDWGVQANLDSIALYRSKGWKIFGGGENEEIASMPLKLSEKGTNITWLGINLSSSTKANGQGASGDHPGANIYNEDLTRSQITEAKTNGNFVIVDIQFSECYCYTDDWSYVEIPSCDAPISGQEEFFKYIADMGADLVVGTQAHQPQTYEFYETTPIYYGLGNLFFDQTYWPGTERGLILTHYFRDGNLIQTRISPTVYDEEHQVHLMDTSTAEIFLARLGEAR